MVMWLLVFLLTGADLFVIAEDVDDITDGESSRKILGQSVVTSVSVVMDIGNGTKTIYSDPLGRPVEKPSNPSDLASPINLLNPDRYEFYTFDDNGNLVRRLMSLDEIKGIIATGDSDGLEYDSTFSESYIPEKRVNDVLSNVQNVLKEEIEIHSNKLNNFPTLDTPDVSDSWNMILPAVFGNSGADITPEKPPMHVTPDTIMIEPTEHTQSTIKSTPWASSSSPISESTFKSTAWASSPSPISQSTFKSTPWASSPSPISESTFKSTPWASSPSPISQSTFKSTSWTSSPSPISQSTFKSTSWTSSPSPISQSTFKSTAWASSPSPISQSTFRSTPWPSSTSPFGQSTFKSTPWASSPSPISQSTFRSTSWPSSPSPIVQSTFRSTSWPSSPSPISQSTFRSTSWPSSTSPMVQSTFRSTSWPSSTSPIVQSTFRSTPWPSSPSPIGQSSQSVYSESSTSASSTTVPKVSGFAHIPSYIDTPATSKINLPSPDNPATLTTEFKEIDQTVEVTTKEYIPLSTMIQNKEEKTTTIQVEESTRMTTTPSESEYIKLEPVSTESTKFNENSTGSTTVMETEVPTTQKKYIATVPDENGFPEMTMQSVESTVNCTSDKNEVLTTSVSLLDDVNSIDEIAAPDILNQLLSTPLDHDFDKEIVGDPIISLITGLEETSTQLNTETTTNYRYTSRSTSEQTKISSTDSTIIKNSTATISSNQFEDASTISSTVPILETESTTISSTDKIIQVSRENTDMTEKTIPEEERTTTFTYFKDTTFTTESIIKPPSGVPVKSTKVETVNETLPAVADYEEPVKSTTETQTTEHLTTVLIPVSLIESSTSTIVNKTGSTVSVPLIESVNKTEDMPAVNVIINEMQQTSTDRSTDQYNATQISTATTETVLVKLPEQSSPKVELSSTTLTITKNDTTAASLTTKDTDNILTTEKKETNWTLVPTIAPHKGSTFESPPSIDNYPELLEPSEPIDLKAEPLNGYGLEESTSALEKDIYQFAQLYNELSFEFWKSATSTLSHARSVVLSPFGAISLLAMIFLGARGSTSAEMNEILKLDDMITFNPHLILKDVGESLLVEDKKSGVATSAIIRELFNDRSKGKLLPFYKERVRAFYDGYVEEVGFSEIGDIVRRRTNLQVKKQSGGSITEFLTDTSLTGRAPLLGLSVNIFQTDCSATFYGERDGEMHFTVLPSIRQRRLVPIPATVYKSGFLAGYEASLDATAVAIGDKTKTVSTIFVMPGQQGMAVLGDGLARLEKSIVESSFKKGAWSRLLRSLIPRPGLEVQIPKISHRSVINATNALIQMGFVELFSKGKADLIGMNGVPNELYLSDLLQVNQFATCGERRNEHHAEIYPSRSARNQRRLAFLQNARDLSGSSFQDPLHDLSYLDLPLPLRPRQARKPDVPRLKFDRPFIYFVRHNPTGLILHIGRFNPRLLP